MIVLSSNQNQAQAEDTEICPTLVASMGMGGGYVPMIVFSAGFCPEESAKTRGIGYQAEKSPSLRQGITPAVVLAIGFDTYNQSETGAVAKSLTSISSDSDHLPCVLIIGEKEDDNSNRKTIL